VLQAGPNAILMSAPDGFSAIVSGGTMEVSAPFSYAPDHRDTGSESNS
jgi:hypothetical protein